MLIMKQEIKIEVPEGMIIDTENSDLENGVIKFKQDKPELPTKWEDLESVGGYYIRSDSKVLYAGGGAKVANRNIYPTKEYAEAALAVCQLIRFRDIYNDHKPINWTTCDDKYVIAMIDGEIAKSYNITAHEILAFHTSQRRDLFLENFKDLIEVAKPLL